MIAKCDWIIRFHMQPLKGEKLHFSEITTDYISVSEQNCFIKLLFLYHELNQCINEMCSYRQYVLSSSLKDLEKDHLENLVSL